MAKTVERDGVSRKAPKGKKKERECSKVALWAMIVLWFIGAFFGMTVVVWQLITAAYTVNIDSVLAYIGAPMTGGIVGYMVKSAVENKEKIKKDAPGKESGGRAE